MQAKGIYGVFRKYCNNKQSTVFAKDYWGKKPKEYQLSLKDWEDIQSKIPRTSLFERVNYKRNFLINGRPVVIGEIRDGEIKRIE
jgi:hypothetical protein